MAVKVSITRLGLLLALLLAGLSGCVSQSGALKPADPSSMQACFERVARDVAPSVVAISATGQPVSSAHNLPVDAPRIASALDRVARTVGTGFVIDRDGFILTNYHVVAGAVEIWITTDDRQVHPAKVVASDPYHDLAVLNTSAAGLKPVKFSTDRPVQRGQWALTLGNPYGLATGESLALSVGVVSATGRSLPRLSAQENRAYQDLIQTTAAINPGNSGGPLFDLDGRVIGINTAVTLPHNNVNGIGFAFAITPDLLRRTADLKAGR